MKNVLMILVSVVVGYSFAYLSASKKWAPFGKSEGKETNYSKTLETQKTDSPSLKASIQDLTVDQMMKMSNYYVDWLADLSHRACKGIPKEQLKMQTVYRGGVITAELIAKWASQHRDIHYVFGKHPYNSPVFLMFDNTTSATGGNDGQLQTSQNYYTYDSDTASMCPPVCPLVAPIEWPIPGSIPVPPAPPGGGQ